MKKHIGNLRITKENEKDFSDITEVTGNVYVSISGEAKFEALETVGGGISVDGTATFEALETVGGNVNVYGEAKFEAPKLETVGGNVDVYGEAKFEALETVGGNVDVSGEATLEAPKLETVGGNVYVSGEAKFEALETVGGYVSVYGEANLEALETVGGYVSVYGEANLEALETVGGYVSVYGEAKFEAPKLKAKNNPKAKLKCEMALEISFAIKGLIKADGILSWVLSERKKGDLTIYKIKIVGKLKASFLICRNNVFSHGDTIKKAIADLMYKVSDRDASEFEHWRKDLDLEITLSDAISAYRTITGACESGTRDFVESIKVPKKLSPKIILKLTEGKYMHGTFKEFLK